MLSKNVLGLHCLLIHICPTISYRIRPNSHTVHLGFSKLSGKLVVKYVSMYTKGTLKQSSAEDLLNDAYVTFFCLFVFFVFFF